METDFYPLIWNPNYSKVVISIETGMRAPVVVQRRRTNATDHKHSEGPQI